MKTTHEALHSTSKIVPCKRCHLSSIYWERFPDCDYAERIPVKIDWEFVLQIAIAIACLIVPLFAIYRSIMRHP